MSISDIMLSNLFIIEGDKMSRKKRKGLWSKPSVYTTHDGFEVKMDSTWEVALAKRLDDLKIKWVRNEHINFEYRTVRDRKRKYIPDFYLPDYETYVEVKGYWTDAARHKMRDVLSRHDIKMIILESLDEIADVDKRLAT